MIQPQINTDQNGLNDITFKINGCAMEVLNSLGHGFHEKIYENALALAMRKRGLTFTQQKEFQVLFDTVPVGTFIPDFVVEDKIILELKTIEKITDHELGQVLNYLRASNLYLGIILNFKHSKLQWQRVAL